MEEPWLYELLFRGQSDGTIKGMHAIRAVTSIIDGKEVDAVGSPQPVAGADVEAIVGEIVTAKAATIAARDARIAELEAALTGAQSRIAELEAAQ